MRRGPAQQAGPTCRSWLLAGDRSLELSGALEVHGSGTGGPHDARGMNAEEREGRTPLDRPPIGRNAGRADTAVSIEREVVFGHAYAIPAPEPVTHGWCGHDNPTLLSVDGVKTRKPWAPARLRRGPRHGGHMAQPDDLLNDLLDDEDYPAYTMGRAAEILGTSQDFLRRLGEANLIDPHRSAGGHRRYSRHQLRLAARARELCDKGTAIEAACRIIILEDQLEEARRHNAHH